MKIKAVIFDLDGVIADSEHLSRDADAMVFEKYGIKLTDKERTDAFGRRTPEIYSDALSARNRHEDVRKMIELKNEMLFNLIRNELKPIQGSIELVSGLKKSGFRLAIASSANDKKVQMELRELGIEGLFEKVVTGSDVSKGKPDPEIFLKAAKELGVKPENCAVVEDSSPGVQAAKDAGMFTIGFKSPNSPGQDLSVADIVINDLRLVIGII